MWYQNKTDKSVINLDLVREIFPGDYPNDEDQHVIIFYNAYSEESTTFFETKEERDLEYSNILDYLKVI